MVTEGDYQKAAREPAYRPRFLREIDLEDAAPYMRAVYKNSDPKPLVKGGYTVPMVTFPSLRARLFIRGTRSRVAVYPNAFSEDKHPCLDDFRSTLIDHEGHHAREFYENPRIIAFSLWEEIMCFWIRHFRKDEVVDGLTADWDRTAPRELRANENQVKNARRRQLSEPYSAKLCKNYADLRALAEAGRRTPA